MNHPEDARLIKQYQSQTPVDVILREFGISSRTMYIVLRRNGVPLRRGTRYRWSAVEDAKALYARWNGATGHDFEGCVPGRSYAATINRLKTLLRGGRDDI